jgi:hypothetical protein
VFIYSIYAVNEHKKGQFEPARVRKLNEKQFRLQSCLQSLVDDFCKSPIHIIPIDILEYVLVDDNHHHHHSRPPRSIVGKIAMLCCLREMGRKMAKRDLRSAFIDHSRIIKSLLLPLT